MKTLEITASEFRKNQKKYLDEVANGTQIILYRGKELFKISAIDKSMLFDDDTQKQIKQSLKEQHEGKSHHRSSPNKPHNFSNKP